MSSNLIEGGKLVLYGPVGLSFGDGDGFTARQVMSALSDLEGDVTVQINSGGGLAFEGVAIFNALKAHDGKITTLIDGIAASAASVIAMAGDEIIMQEGALMMIHNASGLTWGTKADHEKTIELLGKLDGNLASIYAARSGTEKGLVQQLMDAETWLDGDEAVEQGLATQAAGDKSDDPSAFAYKLYHEAPEWLSNKFEINAAQSKQVAREISAHLSREVAAMSAVEISQQKETPIMTDKVKASADNNADATNPVTLESVVANNPEIANELRSEGAATAAQAERDRILGIEDQALPGHESMIAEMKADGKTTPEQAAIRIINAEKALGENRIKAMKDADKEVDLEAASSATGDEHVTDPGASLSPDEIWEKGGEIRSEFTDKESYLAFTKAESAGRVKSLSRSAA